MGRAFGTNAQKLHPACTWDPRRAFCSAIPPKGKESKGRRSSQTPQAGDGELQNNALENIRRAKNAHDQD